MKNKQNGQVGIIVVLVGVVIFTLGMATAARITTDIKIASLAEESAGALGSAEAAAEIALAKPLPTLAAMAGTLTPIPAWKDYRGTAPTPTVAVSQASYTVTAQPTTTNPVYDMGTIFAGTTRTIWLVDMVNGTDPLSATPFVGDLQIFWNMHNEPVTPIPAITTIQGQVELTLYYASVYNNGTPYASTINVKRWLIKSGDCFGANMNCQITIQKDTLPGWSGSSKLLLLRVKSITTAIKNVMVNFGGTSIPTQEFLIEATARTINGSVRKKVEARRLVGDIPLFFDYVLANTTGEIKK